MSGASKRRPKGFLAGYTGPKPVNRSPLHAVHVAATLALLLALAWAEPASAHVEVRPGVLEQGVASELTVELPRLRPGAAPTRLEVEGDLLVVLSSARAGAAGADTLWRVRLRAERAPGPVQLTLRAVYRDGRSVAVRHPLTVLPAREESGPPWRLAVAGALLAVTLALMAFRLARPRSAC